MLKNYFKVSIRNITHSKSYAAINIGGLSVGIACFILTAVYVMHELNYDQFGTHSDDVYRLAIKSTTGDGSGEAIWALSFTPIGADMQEHFPEVEKYGRITRYSLSETIVRHDNNRDQYVKERLFFYADPAIVEMFGYQSIHGNAVSGLLRPNTIAITKSFARRVFTDEDPIGKVLSFGLEDKFEVVAVLEDYKHRSHFGFEGLISYQTYLDNRSQNLQTNEWRWSQCWTYLQLTNDATTENISQNFYTYWNEEVPNYSGKRERAVFMQPLSSIHLDSKLTYEIQPNGNIYYVYLIGLIGGFILFLAVINYMNLATARSMKRMKEIGIRKVMGSGKAMLIGQFLVESIIVVLFATVIAILWVELATPVFSELAGKSLSFDYISNPMLLVVLMSFAIITGVLAGSYPAFYLSSFSISRVFRNVKGNSRGTLSTRRVLVVLQFSITTVLLLATFVVNSQLSFMFNQELGFEKDQVVILSDNIHAPHMLPKMQLIKQELDSTK